MWQVKGLEYDEEHATMSGRKIKEFISALQDVQQFEELDTNLQIKAYLQARTHTHIHSFPHHTIPW